MFTRELQDEVAFLVKGKLIAPFPKDGSTGIYDAEMVKVMLAVTGNQAKLLMVLIAGMSDYNQVIKYNRKEIGYAYTKKYNKSGISRDLAALVDVEAIAYVGNVIMVNPFLAVPRIKQPRLKAAIQYAWESMVMYA